MTQKPPSIIFIKKVNTILAHLVILAFRSRLIGQIKPFSHTNVCLNAKDFGNERKRGCSARTSWFTYPGSETVSFTDRKAGLGDVTGPALSLFFGEVSPVDYSI